MMMSNKSQYAVYQDDAMTAVSLPYASSSLQMLLIMPSASLGDWIAQRAQKDIPAVVRKLTARSIVLQVPKFNFSTRLDALENTLMAMGINDLFDPKRADLSKMLEKSIRGFYLAKLLQASSITVEETGTQVASASAAVVLFGAVMPQTIQFNKPFVFVILDKDSGLIVFIGKVHKP